MNIRFMNLDRFMFNEVFFNISNDCKTDNMRQKSVTQFN